jgi:hypothetical protein
VPIIRKTRLQPLSFAYDRGLVTLNTYLDQLLELGRAYFSRRRGAAGARLVGAKFHRRCQRLIRKRRLANPSHGFYLILRPEDRPLGAPDPVRWIDALMKREG